MTLNATGAEGGIFSGKSVLGTMLAQFLVQTIIVIGLSRLFDGFLRFLRQPRVIAEVISGICLGPSVLGRIPGFTDTIFPKASIAPMQLVANIGLVLYMFLVGLELDPRSFFANMRKTAAISLAGMVVPFGLGVAISYGMYHQLLQSTTVPFSSFLLFTGVAMSITAFPVLARILSERRLFGTTVGSMTISAAAFDDATAWCLLALVLSIINAEESLTALWVFLTMLAYVVVLLVFVRFLLGTFVRTTMRSRRFATATLGQTFLAFIFVFIFVSAWITEFIGVHAIFGAFLVGVIMPRGTGIVVSLTEKIEDLVSIILLPLYFASSGLKTHVNVLNDGITWAWLIAVIIVACIGKVCGCMFAARASRLSWRESFSVGILMNTKGLVELIVLNIGLDAGVINDRIFTLMVMMCLVTTFMTSPLISVIYPKRHQTTVEEALKMKARKAIEAGDESAQDEHWLRDTFNVLACVDRMDQIPSIVGLANKFQVHPPQHPHAAPAAVGDVEASADAHHPLSSTTEAPFNFSVLRLMESSERSSTLFYASSGQNATPAQNDTVLQMMSLFSRLLKLTTKCFYAVAPVDAYNEEVERIAQAEHCNVLLVTIDPDSSDQMVESVLKTKVYGLVPVVYVDRKRAAETKVIAYSPASPNNALNDAFTSSPTPGSGGPMKVLVPFEGGRLDRKALKVALRLSHNRNVHLTVLVVSLVDKSQSSGSSGGGGATSASAGALTNGGGVDTPASAVNGTSSKKYGAISYISSKLHVDSHKSPIDFDAELIAEAKREGEDRPQAVLVRAAVTTSLIDCVIGECKQHTFDLIVLGHRDAEAWLPPPSALPEQAPRSKRSNVNEFTGSYDSGSTLNVPSQPIRKYSSTSIRESFRRRTRHGWVWPSSKESMLGVLGHRLLQSTEASLLVVGQSGSDSDGITNV